MEIHNGADDNASGTVAMIEIARALSRGPALRRTVVFIAFDGEEMGLLGSAHYVQNPAYPLSATIAMLNLDMVGRSSRNAVYVGGTGSSPQLEHAVNEAQKNTDLVLKTAWKSGIAPSDNTSFILKGIPSLFFFTGLHQDYHRPTDDYDRINYDAQAKIVHLVADVVREVDASDERLAFVAPKDSGNVGAMRPGSASLGVVPDYASDDSIKGLRISGATPGSPAAEAGLRAGDILTRLGDVPITGTYDLTNALADRKPKDRVRVVFLRDGREHSVEVTLAARSRRAE